MTRAEMYHKIYYAIALIMSKWLRLQRTRACDVTCITSIDPPTLIIISFLHVTKSLEGNIVHNLCIQVSDMIYYILSSYSVPKLRYGPLTLNI